MTSSERVLKYRHRQQASGRKLVTLFLYPETIKRLQALARRKPRGEVVEHAVNELWRSGNNDTAT